MKFMCPIYRRSGGQPVNRKVRRTRGNPVARATGLLRRLRHLAMTRSLRHLPRTSNAGFVRISNSGGVLLTNKHVGNSTALRVSSFPSCPLWLKRAEP